MTLHNMAKKKAGSTDGMKQMRVHQVKTTHVGVDAKARPNKERIEMGETRLKERGGNGKS